jgi:hypothetical protein
VSRGVDRYHRPSEMMGSRDAARRQVERGLRSILIRLRRAGITFGALIAALAAYMVAFGWVGFFPFLFALFAIALLSLLMLALPVGKPRRREAPAPRPVIDAGQAVRLDRLTASTEHWLLDRSRALPHQAGPALDRIVDRLRDLQPSLSTVPSETPLGGEAKRLIGQHLPSLVDTYLNLPPAERSFQSKASYDLAESLGIVAEQMDDLCERLAHERRLGFETERRFIETRYRDGSEFS